MTTPASRLRADIDFERPGKHRGFLNLSHSVHRSA